MVLEDEDEDFYAYEDEDEDEESYPRRPFYITVLVLIGLKILILVLGDHGPVLVVSLGGEGIFWTSNTCGVVATTLATRIRLYGDSVNTARLPV